MEGSPHTGGHAGIGAQVTLTFHSKGVAFRSIFVFLDGKRRLKPWGSSFLHAPRMDGQDVLGLAEKGPTDASDRDRWHEYRTGLCSWISAETGKHSVSAHSPCVSPYDSNHYTSFFFRFKYVVDPEVDRPCRKATGAPGDPGTTTTLNHILNMEGVGPSKTIADVMDIQGGFLCYEYVEG
jgi:hypothetical protein